MVGAVLDRSGCGKWSCRTLDELETRHLVSYGGVETGGPYSDWRVLIDALSPCQRSSGECGVRNFRIVRRDWGFVAVSPIASVLWRQFFKCEIISLLM
jgi:hypothetical protein